MFVFFSLLLLCLSARLSSQSNFVQHVSVSLVHFSSVWLLPLCKVTTRLEIGKDNCAEQVLQIGQEFKGLYQQMHECLARESGTKHWYVHGNPGVVVGH